MDEEQTNNKKLMENGLKTTINALKTYTDEGFVVGKRGINKISKGSKARIRAVKGFRQENEKHEHE